MYRSGSGVKPNPSWQNCEVVILLLGGGANTLCCPLALRTPSTPTKVPIVTAIGRMKRPTLTSERAPMLNDWIDGPSAGVWPVQMEEKAKVVADERQIDHDFDPVTRGSAWAREE